MASKNKYEDILKNVYQTYDSSKCKVQLDKLKIFICGGLVDIKQTTPPSFRAWFFQECANVAPELEALFIVAESFKDYFRDNIYTDLLIFEDDIASISSLIVIFLESPGSLVEFGAFGGRAEFYKKLLVIVPDDADKDSFINLGPLTHIKKKCDTSVVFYPFPKKGVEYDKEIVHTLIKDTKNKLSRLDKTQGFDKNNRAHVILLVLEIIRLSFPVTLSEIESVLKAFNIPSRKSYIKRYLYLLEKLDYINFYEYSTYKFYYPSNEYIETPFIIFGKNDKNIPFDEGKHRAILLQSYLDLNDDISQKRKSALKVIKNIIGVS